MTVRFLEHEVIADVPYADAAETLQHTGTAWLGGLAAPAASAGGPSARVRVGPGQTSSFRKTFHLTVGAPYRLTIGLLIPTRWQATGTRGLFPTMDADLRVNPAPPRRTRLCLQGSYSPPLGDLGDRLDELVLHRIVDRSVHTFLVELARALGDPDAA